VLRRDSFFRRALALADLVAVVLSLELAITVIGGGALHLRPFAALVLPLVILVNKAAGAYDRDQHQLRKTTIDDAPQILNLSVLYALGVWLGQEAFVDGPLNRGEVFGLAVMAFVFMMLGRTVARAVALRVTPPERCVVLGNAGSAARIDRKMRTAPGVHAVVCGRVSLDDTRYTEAPDAPAMLGHVDMLPVLLSKHGAERVVIAPDGHDQDRILHAVRLIKALGVKVSVLPQLLEVVGSSSTFDEIDGITLLGVRKYGLSPSSEFLKRALDVCAAGLGLVLIAPLLAALALAI
jgi:FlaA1/EpsC-like NDP-sugar epimerase